jgi:hypothetical protein
MTTQAKQDDDGKPDPKFINFYRLEDKLKLLQNACAIIGMCRANAWVKHIRTMVSYGLRYSKNRATELQRAEILARGKIAVTYLRNGGDLDRALAVVYSGNGGQESAAMIIWKNELVEIDPLVTYSAKRAREKDDKEKDKRPRWVEADRKDRGDRGGGGGGGGHPPLIKHAEPFKFHDFLTECAALGVHFKNAAGDKFCNDFNGLGKNDGCEHKSCSFAHKCPLTACRDANCKGLKHAHKETYKLVQKLLDRFHNSRDQGKGNGRGGRK